MSEAEKDVSEESGRPRHLFLWRAFTEVLLVFATGIVVSGIASVLPVFLSRVAPSLIFNKWPQQYKKYGPILSVVISISVGLTVAYVLALKWRAFRESRERRLKDAMLDREAKFIERIDAEFRALLEERV